MTNSVHDSEQDDGLIGWLTSSFQNAANDLWQGSWLQRQFDGAARAISPVNWLQETAEAILGDNVVRSILSLVIAWMDKDKTTLEDDSEFLTGLKRWYDEVDSEIAERTAEEAAEEAAEIAETTDETAPPQQDQGWIPDHVPVLGRF